MHKVLPDSQKGYVNLEPNPDSRDLGEPEDEDAQRIRLMKEAMFQVQARAVKKYLNKRDGGYDSSESDAPSADDNTMLDFGLGQKIAAKNMPRPNTPPPKKSSTASAVGSAPRKAARNVYQAWSQEFSNIQWFAHPGEKFERTNSQDCGCTDAMFWCHKCGSGYCLQCRYDGLTCDHSIAHYSVDTDPDFLPDSIASVDSCFKLKELFDNAINAESRYFGYSAKDQAAYRKDTIDDLYSRARAGDKVGGKLFMKFLHEGVEEYRRASDYSYEPQNGRVPTLFEHYGGIERHADLCLKNGCLGIVAPPSSDWTDRPDIPEFEECLGTTKDMSDDECILVLRGRPEPCDDVVVPSYKTGTFAFELNSQIKEDEVDADNDNLNTGNEMMKKKRLKLKKQKKMKTIQSDGFVQQLHPQEGFGILTEADGTERQGFWLNGELLESLPHLVMKIVAVLHSAAWAFPRLTRIFLATGETGALYNWTTEWCGDTRCVCAELEAMGHAWIRRW
eukprot:s744_g22.t1